MSYLKQNIVTDDGVVLSISGGVDSMVLLHLVSSLALDGLFCNSLYVVTFNHHKRCESLNDCLFVKKSCEKYKIHCLIMDINIEDDNFQNNARLYRYNILKQCAKELKAKYILTAHHLNDLAESIMIKITRGSNLLGYSGFHHRREEDNFVFLKPLYQFSKNEIIKYSLDNSIKYKHDSSNDLDLYLRNKLRHHVIPVLDNCAPNFLNSCLDYHDLLYNSFVYIRQTSINHYNKYKGNLIKFYALADVLQCDLLAYLLEQNNVSFNRTIINNLITLLKNPNKGTFIHLINKDVVLKKYHSYFEIVSKYSNNDLSYTLRYEHHQFNKKSDVLWYNHIEYPLYVRTYKKGDSVKMPYGSKSLLKLMNDHRIPSFDRNKILILVDSNDTILYVDGIYINKELGTTHSLFIKRVRQKGANK